MAAASEAVDRVGVRGNWPAANARGMPGRAALAGLAETVGAELAAEPKPRAPGSTGSPRGDAKWPDWPARG
ncbi:hypothetical protein ACIGXM_22850 [Kitasatospora sp. NPDC052896]|uniref:hypothetical protein n=1 Tax=Kitasatospora sp. NPDC052896 TaxID=3364061 RepID=UPI0037CA4042